MDSGMGCSAKLAPISVNVVLTIFLLELIKGVRKSVGTALDVSIPMFDGGVYPGWGGPLGSSVLVLLSFPALSFMLCRLK